MRSFEHSTRRRTALPKALMAAGMVVMSSMAAASCGPNKSASPSTTREQATTTTTAPQIQPVPTTAANPGIVDIAVNLTNFDYPGTNECYNEHDKNVKGNPPCAALLRLTPNIAAAGIVNADPYVTTTTIVTWPLQNTVLPVECYEPGESITSYDHGYKSGNWYRVIVGISHVLNPYIKNEIVEANSPINTFNYQGQESINAYASVEWMGSGNGQLDAAVKACNP